MGVDVTDWHILIECTGVDGAAAVDDRLMVQLAPWACLANSDGDTLTVRLRIQAVEARQAALQAFAILAATGLEWHTTVLQIEAVT